ncbi:MAG: hypothetical protein PHI23_01995 [Candidatus Peribacteraceae bacterium]|nr:hypothetical protein [Candidatus Peribacteraceae bacterium]
MAVFFALFLLVGSVAFRAYGITWDEKTQYLIGFQAFNSLTKGTPWTAIADWRYFGTTFELLLILFERPWHIEDAMTIFLLRHFVTFLSFFTGVVFFYLLAYRRFRNWQLPLLGCLFLILSPRIFGHAFYNSKDIPTLASFIMSMYTLLLFLERQTLSRALLHAIACAVLVTIRMTGIVLPVITLLLLSSSLLAERRADAWRPLLVLSVTYLTAWMLFTIAIWPYLWGQPFGHFLEAYHYMTTKGGGGLFMGKMSPFTWYWIPVWIFVSTPLLYTALFLVGCIRTLSLAIRQPLIFIREKRTDASILLWFFLPLVSLMVSGAGIYDDWRHVFFLYPAFLFLALIGMETTLRWFTSLSNPLRTTGQGIIASLLLFSTVSTATWMARNHPFECVYFSLPSRWIDGKFELDYWGLSYRQGFEYVLAHDSAPVISFHVTSSPGWAAPNILPWEQRQRIALTGNPQVAQYILDNFRAQEYKKTFSPLPKVHAITVSGIEILGIYRNPSWKPEMLNGIATWPSRKPLFFL